MKFMKYVLPFFAGLISAGASAQENKTFLPLFNNTQTTLSTNEQTTLSTNEEPNLPTEITPKTSETKPTLSTTQPELKKSNIFIFQSPQPRPIQKENPPTENLKKEKNFFATLSYSNDPLRSYIGSFDIYNFNLSAGVENDKSSFFGHAKLGYGDNLDDKFTNAQLGLTFSKNGKLHLSVSGRYEFNNPKSRFVLEKDLDSIDLSVLTEVSLNENNTAKILFSGDYEGMVDEGLNYHSYGANLGFAVPLTFVESGDLEARALFGIEKDGIFNEKYLFGTIGATYKNAFNQKDLNLYVNGSFGQKISLGTGVKVKLFGNETFKLYLFGNGEVTNYKSKENKSIPVNGEVGLILKN